MRLHDRTDRHDGRSARGLLVVALFALTLGCLATARTPLTRSKPDTDTNELVMLATSRIRELGFDPARYRAVILEVDPRSRFLELKSDAGTRRTVLFDTREGGDNYPLWVSDVEQGQVEWWLDGRPLTDAQSAATIAACKIMPAWGCGASGVDHRTCRVLISENCLVFVFWTPPSSAPGSKNVIGEDIVIALDKQRLVESFACASAIQRSSVWR